MATKPKKSDLILDTALTLFNEQGSYTVTTNHIAKAMGISPGNLYYHFKNKEHIIRELLARLVKGFDSIVAIQADVTYYNEAYRNLASRMQGAPLSDDLDEIGETVARFSKITEPFLSRFIKSLIPQSGPVKIMDVGCGSGFALKSAWQANSKVSGIGIEMDEKVAAQAKENLNHWGLADRFRILLGDIRSQADAHHGGFDLITAFNLVYYVPVDERPAFFSLLRSLLHPRGCLALVNNFQSRGSDAAAANLNIVNCSLDKLTALPNLQAIKKQLAACGFSRIQTTRFMPRSEFYGVTAYT